MLAVYTATTIAAKLYYSSEAFMLLSLDHRTVVSWHYAEQRQATTEMIAEGTRWLWCPQTHSLHHLPGDHTGTIIMSYYHNVTVSRRAQPGGNSSVRGRANLPYVQQHISTAWRAMWLPTAPLRMPAPSTGPSWSHPTGTATCQETTHSGFRALGGLLWCPTDYVSSLAQLTRRAAPPLSNMTITA